MDDPGSRAADLAYGPAQKAFGAFPAFDPEDGVTVFAPEARGAGHWVGCPSVFYDPASETVLLTYRQRRRRGEPLDRGWRCAVAESTDGISFRYLWAVENHELGSTSMERFCLHRDEHGRYRLYTSYEHPDDGRWRIDVLEAAAPDAFDVTAARTVLTPTATGTAAVKDPYVVRVGPAYLMYVSTFLADDGPAPTCLAISSDGLSFRWIGETLGVGTGWDRHQTRLSGIVRAGGVYVGLYDGAASAAEDTEERLGLAVSLDLRHWVRLTVDGPVLVSPHATGSLRYADALELDGEWWIYYEYARADGSHELRLNRVPAAS